MTSPGDIPKVPGIGFPRPAPAPPATDISLGGRGPGAPLPLPGVDQADIRPLDVAGGLQILIAEVRAALEETLLAALGGPTAAPDEPVPLTLLPPGAPGSAAPPGPAPSVGTLPGAGDTPTGAPGTLPGRGANATLLAAGLPGFAGPPAGTAPDAARQVLELVLAALPPETGEDQALARQLPALDLAIQSSSQRTLSIVAGWRDVPPATRDAAQAATQLIASTLSDEPLNAAWLRPDWAGLLPRLEQYRRRRRRLRRRFEDPDDPRRGPPEDDERR